MFKEKVMDIKSLDPSLYTYTWTKDENLRFFNCNENFARILNLDSPRQIKGKKDIDMPWETHAGYFNYIDSLVVCSQYSYVNVIENLYAFGQSRDIIVTKYQNPENPLYCDGIAIDINVHHSCQESQYIGSNRRYFSLGKKFNNAYLTKREIDVIKHILLGYSAKKTALRLSLSYRTIESYIEAIKTKLKCSSKGEIIELLVSTGLIYKMKFSHLIL
jgi:DNA-binding CsgD family transcriptional regulator